MKARLQEVHTVGADQINQPILACDTPRPDIRADLLEVLGLSDAGKGISHHSLDQIKNSYRCPWDKLWSLRSHLATASQLVAAPLILAPPVAAPFAGFT